MELRHFHEGDVEILRDELQKMILRLEEQTELLKKEKMSLADSLADISHQIRTPLTTLNLLIERMKKVQMTSGRGNIFSVRQSRCLTGFSGL